MLIPFRSTPEFYNKQSLCLAAPSRRFVLLPLLGRIGQTNYRILYILLFVYLFIVTTR